MPTVLRVSGRYEQLRESLSRTTLEFVESVAARKRREQDGTTYDGMSTFNFTVSDAGGGQVPLQIEESTRFLSENTETIREIRRTAGVEGLCLDFDWDFSPTGSGQCNRFPSSFLGTCAALGIDIEVSVYAVSQGGQ